MKIFVDLDEVLCDWVGGVCRLLGETEADLTAKWGAYWNDAGMWEAIGRAGEGFWAGLEPLPWLSDLVALVGEYAAGDQWYVTTSPSRDSLSYAGKAIWVRMYLGLEPRERMIPFADKALFAGPGRVLIDDLSANVEAFAAAGGYAVLFPHRRNNLKSYADDPVPYLRSALPRR